VLGATVDARSTDFGQVVELDERGVHANAIAVTSDDVRAALDMAFPAAWREILEHRVPFFRSFSDAEKERFEDKVQHFVLTKTFSGTHGLEITDEMKVVVAAAACRLTLNLPWQEYTHVGHVALHAERAWEHDNVAVVGLGSRWKVTLSWPNLIESMAASDDGHNVGFHEFAHALDGADGSMDGEPQGPPTSLSRTWAKVVADAHAQVVAAVRANAGPPLDAYAATSVVELFAVATEWFFERPHDVRSHLPELYKVLSDFYRQDPCARTAT
jgi:Mlc titration factor MtfA (ptsG expression regulator)